MIIDPHSVKGGSRHDCRLVMFVGKDVATALGYAKPENAIATHVDVDDKTTTLIQGTGSNYKSKVIIINESGLYSLILSSKLPQAKAFKRWVTAEVQHCNNCKGTDKSRCSVAVVAVLKTHFVHMSGKAETKNAFQKPKTISIFIYIFIYI